MKQHIPILVSEILHVIPTTATLVVDGTFGHAGHTIACVEYFLHTQRKLQLLGFDRDAHVLQHGKQYFDNHFPHLPETIQIQTIHDTYDHIADYVEKNSVDFILLDLGINREHVTDDNRGFSFQGSGPLDMRFDQTRGVTAQELIAQSDHKTLQSWFVQYADYSEKRAEYIAKLLMMHTSMLHTTSDLTTLLRKNAIGHKELAPIYQAIRIAVNNEFGYLHQFFNTLDMILGGGGRCAILSFHSIEDRIIKYAFKDLASQGGYTILTKHTIKPSWQEIQHNKAARSAQLRVIEKVH